MSRGTAYAFGAVLAAALFGAGCPQSSAGPNDASAADAQWADTTLAQDGADAQCLGTIELSPVTFVNGYAGTRQTCAEAGVEPVRVWAWRDGVLVRDASYKCGERITLAGLELGEYQVAAMGFVDGAPFGGSGPMAFYVVGASLLPGVYEGYVAPCTPGLAPCEPIVVDLAGGDVATTGADVYCWEGVSLVADGCGF